METRRESMPDTWRRFTWAREKTGTKPIPHYVYDGLPQPVSSIYRYTAIKLISAIFFTPISVFIPQLKIILLKELPSFQWSLHPFSQPSFSGALMLWATMFLIPWKHSTAYNKTTEHLMRTKLQWSLHPFSYHNEIRNKWHACILGHFFMFSSCGIVFVTTTASNAELFNRWMAGPEKIPCTQNA